MIKVKPGEPAPPPDLKHKPKDVSEYAFAPVCDLDHVTGFGKTEINIKDLELLTACSTCGRPARYQTILRTAGAQWCQRYDWLPGMIMDEDQRWGWVNRSNNGYGNYLWSKAERVRSITL